MARLMREFEAEVRRGIDLLDKRGPREWRNKIDLASLNMSRCSRCILGQIFGAYITGTSSLRMGPSWHETAHYGFDLPGGPLGLDSKAWDALRDEWIRQIEETQSL